MTLAGLDVAAAVADGSAVRRLIVADEAWYHDDKRAPGVIEEWWLGLDARRDGHDDGTHGEVNLTWRVLGRKEAWRLEAFGDGLPAVVAAGLLDVLFAYPDADRPTLRAALEAAGWSDLTPRERPGIG